MPPMNGPNAGPMSVPDMNHPIAVPRSVGRYMSLFLVSMLTSLPAVSVLVYAKNGYSVVMLAYPRQAAPMRMKEVPSKAEMARKTKKAARFGANAVPRLSTRNATAVMSVIYAASQQGSKSLGPDHIREEE